MVIRNKVDPKQFGDTLLTETSSYCATSMKPKKCENFSTDLNHNETKTDQQKFNRKVKRVHSWRSPEIVLRINITTRCVYY